MLLFETASRRACLSGSAAADDEFAFELRLPRPLVDADRALRALSLIGVYASYGESPRPPAPLPLDDEPPRIIDMGR